MLISHSALTPHLLCALLTLFTVKHVSVIVVSVGFLPPWPRWNHCFPVFWGFRFSTGVITGITWADWCPDRAATLLLNNNEDVSQDDCSRDEWWLQMFMKMMTDFPAKKNESHNMLLMQAIKSVLVGQAILTCRGKNSGRQWTRCFNSHQTLPIWRNWFTTRLEWVLLMFCKHKQANKKNMLPCLSARPPKKFFILRR